MSESQWFWNLLAKRYDRQVWKDENYTRAVEELRTYLEPDDTVLDYACGTGVISIKIADAVRHVHAIDFSAKMIGLARKRAQECGSTNVHFEQKTIFDETLGKDSYDVVVAFNILHLLEDARETVKRAFELLKPEGLLVSSTPCLGDAGALLRIFVPLIGKVGILSNLRPFSLAEVRDLQRGGGFDILESKTRGESIPLCYVVARKRSDACVSP